MAVPDPEPSRRVKFNILKRFIRFLSRKTEGGTNFRETIEELIEESQETNNAFASDERALLGNVLNLRDLTAQDVMIPRIDIIAVPLSVGEDELLKTMVSSRLKQILVYKDTLDEIVGMIQVQDALSWIFSKKPFNIKSLIREVLFISPALGTLELLLQMRESGTKVALVVDEFGGIDGLVTVSDLTEEIIGHIQDVQDPPKQPYLNRRADGVIIADGRITLEELQNSFSINLIVEDLEDEIETLGGLVTTLAGHVPHRGEIIKHPSGCELEVVDADLRRVKRIHIHKLTP